MNKTIEGLEELIPRCIQIARQKGIEIYQSQLGGSALHQVAKGEGKRIEYEIGITGEGRVRVYWEGKTVLDAAQTGMEKKSNHPTFIINGTKYELRCYEPYSWVKTVNDLCLVMEPGMRKEDSASDVNS